jgi:hypothetical protein
MARNPTNPDGAGGPNEYVKPIRRADQSTVGGASGSYYKGSNENGNVVDRSRINKTLDNVSNQGSPTKPGGTSSGSGY